MPKTTRKQPRKHFDILTGQTVDLDAEAGKVPDSPDMRGEAGFESPSAQPRPTPEEVMAREYSNVGSSIPELLRAILKELVIARVSR